MERLVKIADYILALQENNVTKEIRENFASVITDEITALEKFALLVKNVLIQVNKTLTVDEAYALIKYEYTNLPFEFYLEEFDVYSSFVHLILSIKQEPLNTRSTIKSLKSYMYNINTLNPTIQAGIYATILRTLVHSNLIIGDVEFAKNIINYVKNHGDLTESEELFAEITMSALNEN